MDGATVPEAVKVDAAVVGDRGEQVLVEAHDTRSPCVVVEDNDIADMGVEVGVEVVAHASLRSLSCPLSALEKWPRRLTLA